MAELKLTEDEIVQILCNVNGIELELKQDGQKKVNDMSRLITAINTDAQVSDSKLFAQKDNGEYEYPEFGKIKSVWDKIEIRDNEGKPISEQEKANAFNTLVAQARNGAAMDFIGNVGLHEASGFIDCYETRLQAAFLRVLHKSLIVNGWHNRLDRRAIHNDFNAIANDLSSENANSFVVNYGECVRGLKEDQTYFELAQKKVTDMLGAENSQANGFQLLFNNISSLTSQIDSMDEAANDKQKLDAKTKTENTVGENTNTKSEEKTTEENVVEENTAEVVNEDTSTPVDETVDDQAEEETTEENVVEENTAEVVNEDTSTPVDETADDQAEEETTEENVVEENTAEVVNEDTSTPVDETVDDQVQEEETIDEDEEVKKEKELNQILNQYYGFDELEERLKNDSPEHVAKQLSWNLNVTEYNKLSDEELFAQRENGEYVHPEFGEIKEVWDKIGFVNDKGKPISEQEKAAAFNLFLEQTRNETAITCANKNMLNDPNGDHDNGGTKNHTTFRDAYQERLQLNLLLLTGTDAAIRNLPMTEVNGQFNALINNLSAEDAKPITIKYNSYIGYQAAKQTLMEQAQKRLQESVSKTNKIINKFCDKISDMDKKLHEKYGEKYDVAKGVLKSAGWGALYGAAGVLSSVAVGAVATVSLYYQWGEIKKGFEKQKAQVEARRLAGEKVKNFGWFDYVKNNKLQIAGATLTVCTALVGLGGAIHVNMSALQATKSVGGLALMGSSITHNVSKAYNAAPKGKKTWAAIKALGTSAAGFFAGFYAGHAAASGTADLAEKWFANSNDSVDSATSGENTTPNASAEHVVPADTVANTAPAASVEHTVPADTVANTTPAASAEHTAPADTVANTAPAASVEHTVPADTVANTAPAVSAEHAAPVDTVANTTPAASAEPSIPVDSGEHTTPPASGENATPNAEAVVENNIDVNNLTPEQQHDIKMLIMRDPAEANDILGQTGGDWMNSHELQEAWDNGTISDEQKADLLKFADQRFDKHGNFVDVDGRPSAESMENAAKDWSERQAAADNGSQSHSPEPKVNVENEAASLVAEDPAKVSAEDVSVENAKVPTEPATQTPPENVTPAVANSPYSDVKVDSNGDMSATYTRESGTSVHMTLSPDGEVKALSIDAHGDHPAHEYTAKELDRLNNSPDFKNMAQGWHQDLSAINNGTVSENTHWSALDTTRVSDVSVANAPSHSSAASKILLTAMNDRGR